MLENLDREGIKKLSDFVGTPMNDILISMQSPGTLIRIVARSNKCYVLEVVDPKSRTAHIVRCKPTHRGKPYLGLHGVTPSLLAKGDTIECANGTSFEMIEDITRIERLDSIILPN
ncbi:MAG: hypothetical protein ACHQU0_03030 [Candidatus Paceibacteria bacterium]